MRTKLPVIPDRGKVVFDVETTGVDWKKDRIVGIVVTLGPSEKQSWYIPIRHEGGNNLPEDQVLAWLRDWARRPELLIVGHNLKFDLHMAANEGVYFAGRLECTMVNAALIDENAGTYKLEECAKRAKVPQKRADEMYNHLASIFGGDPDRKQMVNFHRLAGDDFIAQSYAIGDGVATWCLHEEQQKEIEAQELGLVHGVECRVIRTLFRMERRGVKIDEEKAARFKQFMEEELEQAKRELPPDFNVRSNSQVMSYVMSSGASGWPLTAKQNPSFPEAYLETIPVGAKIIKVRKYSNLLNSFVVPLLEEHIHKGRVHTNFNQTKQDDYGVVTGRLSSNAPNEQQVPKRNKVLGRPFRALHVSDPGLFWSANDYSQQEFRVFADYSGSPTLLAGYSANPPIDIHSSVAEMLGVERDPTAKRMNLGMLYGMGVKKLGVSLGIAEEDAAHLRNMYHAKFPEVKDYLKKAEYWARQRGWVRTKLKRRRRFPDPTYAHKAGNAVIQGTSADITKLKMVEIDELFAANGDICHLLLQVHDELDWQFPDTPEGRKLDAMARVIMTSFGPDDLIQMKVPMAVDAKIGANWGDATYGPEDKDGKKEGRNSKGPVERRPRRKKSA